MSIQQLSKQKYLIIAILIFIVIIVVQGNGGTSLSGLKFSGDLLNLVAVSGGILGVWQVIATNLEAIRQQSDKRDQWHDDQIGTLRTRIETIFNQLELHEKSVGHAIALQQILQIKDQISYLNAALAVSTRQGEFALKLELIERELQQNKAK